MKMLFNVAALFFSINSWAFVPATIIHPITGAAINTTQLDTLEEPPLP
jgi:hypothetical protein